MSDGVHTVTGHPVDSILRDRGAVAGDQVHLPRVEVIGTPDPLAVGALMLAMVKFEQRMVEGEYSNARLGTE